MRRCPGFCVDVVDDVVIVTFAMFPLTLLAEFDAASFCSGTLIRFAADVEAERPANDVVAREVFDGVRRLTESRARETSSPLICDKWKKQQPGPHSRL